MRLPITFSCVNHIPQDGEWGDHDELIRVPGFTESTVIADLLTRDGYRCIAPEPDTEHYCWTIDAKKGDRHFTVSIGDIDESELIVSASESLGCLFTLLGRSGNPHDLLHDLYTAMSKDERFANLRWETF